jgi:hypothetical protein
VQAVYAATEVASASVTCGWAIVFVALAIRVNVFSSGVPRG